ncbi:DUF4159 domain-containing protein [Rhodobacteraceae bacterium DSL-40]|uniref:DUF4159 domain-containing protein n=1 Tax=Amaricoccus sp. B4 TaxID=3368557 RepID=UPI000DAD354A
MSIGPLAFLTPWLLAAFVVLPVLWWLLRAVPPAARRLPFPGVRLLLDLDEKERMPARTPWWLLLLRIVALAAAILAFSEPVLNPRAERGEGPLLVLIDGGWGDAPDWPARMSRIAGELTEAERDGRPVAVLSLADGPPAESLPLRAAPDWADRLAGLAPRPWSPETRGWIDWIGAQDQDFETLWLSDGLAHGEEAALARALLAHGPVSIIRPASLPRALTPPRLEQGALQVTALRVPDGTAMPVTVTAFGPDPNGVERALGRGTGAFETAARSTDIAIQMPVELRNRVARIQLAAGRSAAGVALVDDALRRRKVGILSGSAGSEAQDLVDPLNYLRKALEPFAETIAAPLPEMLLTSPDMLILADVGNLADSERAALTEWVEKGGVLVRFAGPRLASSGAGQLEADPLLPVRLRAGGRSVGGAMSWGAPRHLQPFAEDGPFAGLPLPGDVEIRAQVMAQPDPDLPDRVIASLEDGTPLVTSAPLGEGRVVLFHVTASADWSNLPLSGLFVQMLERLTQSAGGLGEAGDAGLDGAVWTPVRVLDGFGELQTPSLLAGVPGEKLAEGRPSRDVPPGFYASGARRTALNVMAADATLVPLPPMPEGVVVEGMDTPQETFIGPWLLALALLLLATDLLVTLRVSGRLSRLGRSTRRATAAVLLIAAGALAGLPGGPGAAAAQETDDAMALYEANHTVLAYVRTGNTRVDQVSEAGLKGLSRELFERTAIDPADPVGINLETDDLTLLPLLYWPVTEGQQPPSDAAYARLNEYLRHGGMILFDTRDSDIAASYGGTTPNGRALQRIALKLDIPPLVQVPPDHVLTRTFYLLQDFPGRWFNAPVWVEAPQEAETVEGLPFRNLNDGVTPVVIGGNDWASAWAIGEDGRPLFPVGRGLSGERQREMSYRFGINLVMHVMTGNYKSDQVHVPALLDRLGQ